MPSVADRLRQHGQVYRQPFGQRMPAVHRKLLSANLQCRSGELGWLIYACLSCQMPQWVARSCGNRHCPSKSTMIVRLLFAWSRPTRTASADCRMLC